MLLYAPEPLHISFLSIEYAMIVQEMRLLYTR